jgi:hypothetical protein
MCERAEYGTATSFWGGMGATLGLALGVDCMFGAQNVSIATALSSPLTPIVTEAATLTIVRECPRKLVCDNWLYVFS